MLVSRDIGLLNDRNFFVNFYLIKFRVRIKEYEFIVSKINGCKIILFCFLFFINILIIFLK